MLVFVGVIFVVVGLIHLYLWKRLVRDTLPAGRARRAAGLLVLALAVLVPATLIGTRSGVHWLAWPGYLWLALMFYLLVILVLLEVPRLVARVLTGRRRAGVPAERKSDLVGTGTGPQTGPGTAPGGPAPVALAPHGPAAPAAVADPDRADVAAPVPPPDGPPAAAPGAQAPDPGRRLLLARGAAIFAGLTAAGLTGYGVRTALGPPQLDRVRIPLAKLPRSMDGTRIALVSDIHIGPLLGRAHTERIVATINALDADLVAVVGDLVDGTVAELGPAAAPLGNLKARQGSFFVTGNHEYFSGHEEWVAEVARLGLRPLRNERQEIATRGGVLDLAGVNDLTGAEYADGPDHAKALAGRDPSRPVVLLAHQPVQAEQAAAFGVDLQLSGHTHGGQMVPFNLLVGLAQPVVSGLGTVDGTQVYVTNGAGFWGPPVRVGAPPQVTLVELRSTG